MLLIQMQMDTAFFRAFFASSPSTSGFRPAAFNEETPVVVAEFDHEAAGQLLGVSKVKGGNRYETTHLLCLGVVFYPPEKLCRLWVTV